MTSKMSSKNSRSLKVFRPFIKRLADDTLDVSGIISRDCYVQWMRARHSHETDDEAHKFHRTLTNHDGRCPFDPKEEAAVLGLLRMKKSWPCFPKHLEHLGRRYRAMGHHEKQLALEGDYIPLPAVMLEPLSPMLQPRTSLPEPEPLHPLQSWSQKDNDNDLGKILLQLGSEDASYLTQLAEHMVRNFASEYSTKDRQAIDDIFRFMILGRTKRCCQDFPASPKQTAKQLCHEFAHTDDMLVFVCDFAANNQEERVLAQNFVCNWVMGDLEGKCVADTIHQHDLLRVLVAIGGAFHQPSIPFTVARQHLFNPSTLQTKQMNMTYIVDPSSFLLVGFGRSA
ncbi:hypothetical protein BASA81_007887 [Batrachochytrium salamandrivorans]|nr:hypothetical protein BASA81_007887 [Batrachochytrium salamandrivorans]